MLPTPDAQSPKPLSPYPHQASATHSTSTNFPLPTTPARPASLSASATDASDMLLSASADFSHSWDLATGGLKTLTAKRELPPRQQRRVADAPQPEPTPVRSYMFLLAILACIVIMLISGGVVLFMTLQP
jgi:hypothetical protein